jgi:hypothetical protein
MSADEAGTEQALNKLKTRRSEKRAALFLFSFPNSGHQYF